jgi:hypothetical protein
VTTTLSLVVNEARTPAIHSLADMKGALVGLQAATTDYDAALVMQRRGEIGSIKVYPFDRLLCSQQLLRRSRGFAYIYLRAANCA